jgi:hypothetical protein
MLCLSNETLSLVSAGLIRLLSIPIVACFALSLAAATEPPPIKQIHANGIDLAYVARRSPLVRPCSRSWQNTKSKRSQ